MNGSRTVSSNLAAQSFAPIQVEGGEVARVTRVACSAHAAITSQVASDTLREWPTYAQGNVAKCVNMAYITT